MAIHSPDDGHLEGPPLICLAGLTRNGRDFQPLAERLTSGPQGPRTVILIDSRGRGLSERDPDPARYSVPVEAADVLTVMDTLDIPKADFIGTSRGGLILHVLGATAPERLGKLVLNDIGPVIGLKGMRHIQAYLDPSPRPARLREVIAALRIVHGDAFPALGADDWEEMARAIYRGPEEAMIPDVDPAIAAAVKALDLGQPLPDLWALFDNLTAMPMLVIRGEHSRLLEPQVLEEMLRRHPKAESFIAAGQGHAPLLHLPDVYAAIAAFLAG